MSLDAFGGVLVNSPGELTVQPLLAPQSGFMTQTAFIQGPPTEITLDEDDVFQCGRCKKVFTSFQLFMFHKKEHQLTSSGSKFFGVGMALTLDGDIDGDLESSLSDVGLVDQGVCLSDSVVQSQCCQELPLQDLDSNSQQDSSDVLEYGALGESTFDELHSDMSQPMMLGDSDSMSFSMEQTPLSISNTDQLHESGFVASSISDIQSTILPDKLIQHEDCETSCDTVWHLSQKDDSSSLNFASSGFGQPLFLEDKKFNVRIDDKLGNIEYSNDGLLQEVSYTSDKEVFINESSITVQEAESQEILPSGEFFSKNSMDYMSNNDILTELEKVGQSALADAQISEPVTIFKVEMPLLASDSLHSSQLDATVPPLIPIQEHVMQDECSSSKGRNAVEHLSPIVIQETSISQESGIAQESIICSQDAVFAEEMLLQHEPITKQIVCGLKGNFVKKSRTELKNLTKPLLLDEQDLCRLQSLDEQVNSSNDELAVPKLKQTKSTHKKNKSAKNSKNYKSVKASSMLPSSSIVELNIDPFTSTVAPLEVFCEREVKKKHVKESSWEPRVLKLTCEFCNKKFAKQFDLQQHLRSHTGEKPFQCIVCGRAFAQKSNVTKHIRTHKLWPKGVVTLPQNFLQKVDLNKKADLGLNHTFKKGEGKNYSIKLNGDDGCDSIGDDDLQDLANEQLISQGKGTKRKKDSRIEGEEYVIDNSYLCQFCNTSFLTYFELKAHLKNHEDEKVYFCKQKGCKQTFPDLHTFVDHMQAHGSLEATYRCHVCKVTFNSLEDLGTHQYTHAKNAQRIYYKRSAIKCTECRSRFLSPEALDQHMLTASHEHPCPECKRIFKCERNLRRHLTTHRTVCPYVCKECGKGFKTEGYLNMHLTMHSKDKPFTCSQCPAKFARKDRLSRHFLIHEESKRLKCPFYLHLQCHREFTRKDKLKAHVFTHTDHENLDCATCKRELSNFSWKKKNQPPSPTVSDGECEPSFSEEAKESSKDSSATDQDDIEGSPSSMDSPVALESHDDLAEATTLLCADDSTCFLSSEDLPTVEIIVMPLRLSIS